MRFFLLRFLILLTLLPGLSPAEPPAPELPHHLRDGFAVWESNRTGAWRIFRRSLSGGSVEQISPDEPDRDHFAAHISPDGTRVVYLSYPRGRHGYRKQPPDMIIPMYLIEPGADSPPRRIMENARPYGEHRAAVWIDDTRLYFIDASYTTRKLNLETGELKTVLTDRPAGRSWDHGYLLDATGQWVFSGLPGFFRFHTQDQSVIPGDLHPGCQPFVTRDGVWGYWMLGMGGPLSRIHLPSGQTGNLLEKNDPRMPEDRSYIYFPHISPCRQLLIFAASPDQHDHHKSDYDLFVVPLDPAELALTGRPQRFTFSTATDRFPEVFLPKPDFPGISAKAPYRHVFDPDEEYAGWQWAVNGEPVSAPAHRFTLPGQYQITATRGEEIRRGLVNIRPARPPELLSAALAAPREILLRFNEPVDISKAVFETAGAPLPATPEADRYGVRLRLPEAPEDAVTLKIQGVQDTAQHPNVMPPKTVEVHAARWPVNPEGLVLVWENGGGQRRLFPPGREEPVTLNLVPQRRARFTAHRAMLLDGGAYLAPDADDALLQALRDAPGLTLEAVIHTRRAHQSGPARILSFSGGTGSRNFTLGQEADRFVLRLRTDNTGPNAHQHTVDLGPVNTDAPVHLLVTYRPGQLTAYVNGEAAATHRVHQGGFASWEPHQLIFGAETGGDRDWAGTLEGVAIYARAMDADEAAANAEQAMRRLDAQTPVPATTVEARLTAATPAPSLAEIDPYRSIMVVHEYERIRTLNGPEAPERFRVHHWGLLDAAPQPLPAAEPGDRAVLVLEPFSDHKHLQELFPADSLEPDFDIPIFLDTAP